VNLNQLDVTISKRTGIPVGQVRQVNQALLTELAQLVQDGGQLRGPLVRLTTRTIQAHTIDEPDGSQRHIPEQRVAVLRLQPTKQAQAKPIQD
jgi:hypothetical protein